MTKGRKNSCAMNIRDWLVQILDGQSDSAERWVRIYGLTTLKYSTDSETEDGSAADDEWQEPYVIRRSARLTLSGHPVVDAESGDRDEGQELLSQYGEKTGCDGDATLRLIDPYGHAMEADYIVTAVETGSDDGENGVSWELMQVGAPETLPYVQMQSVTLMDGSAPLAGVTIRAGSAPKVVGLAFVPENASNRRYRVHLTGKRYAAISNVTENSFTVTPLAEGEASVTVTTLNGGRTATLRVTVTE